MVYVLDTHPIVWFLEGARRLGPAAKATMSDPAAYLVIPTIAPVEIAFLYAKESIRVDLPAV